MADRQILYKIKPFLQNGKVADAVDVQYDNSNANGLLAGATQVKQGLDRIDATGLGAPVTTFTGNYTQTFSNRNQWFNRHTQGAQGQGNARRTYNLANDTELANVINNDDQKNYPFTVTISYLGGTAGVSSLSNRLRVQAQGGSRPISGRSGITLTHGESVTLQRVMENEDWIVISEGGLSTTSGTTLDDIELQPEGWNAAPSSFLPQNALKGYAYQVFNAPTDGSGRFSEVMYNGDWIVAQEDITNWADTSQWFVIAAQDVRRITQQQANFLAQITESDAIVRGGQIAGGLFQAWLTPATFATAPYIDPTQDPENPRPGQTVPYVGGRNEFSQSANFFQAFLYVGVSPSYLISNSRERIIVVFNDLEDGDVRVLNLQDNFHPAPNSIDNSTYRYFVYSTFVDPNTFATLNYINNQTIRAYRTSVVPSFTLSQHVDVTNNVNGLPESRLSAGVQGKLNRGIALNHDDRLKLDSISETSTSDTIANSPAITFKVFFGQPNADINVYHDFQTNVGLVPDFSPQFITLIIPDNVTVTHLKNDAVTAVTPSLIAGYNMYTVTMSASGDPLNDIRFPVGTVTTISRFDLDDIYEINENNLSPSLDALIHRDTQYQLPPPLSAINNQARVFYFDNTDFVGNNPHIGVRQTATVLKNKPELGAPYPITANLFVNEITNSDVTLTPPSNLGDIYIPRMIGGQLDNGVDVITRGAMTGSGIVDGSFDINMQDDANFRLVIGMWFYVQQDATTYLPLLQIKERGVSTYRDICGVDSSGLVFRRSNQDGGTFSETVDHTLYGTDGVLTHVFKGPAAQEELWRVYEARTYTINARLIANGNDEGSTTYNYTITDINTSQGRISQTLVFSGGSHPHSQEIFVEYRASSSTYGGPGHTLRVDIEQLTDNPNFDIDHILMSVTYQTTRTVTRSNTYQDVPQNNGDVRSQRLHKVIMSLRANTGNNNLEVLYTLYGYDAQGRPQIYDENVDNLNYITDDLDYSSLRFFGNGMVGQNIQVAPLNTDTPLAQFPTHAQLRDYQMNHDNKQVDYLWGNLAAPDQHVEVVHVPETINMTNFMQESPDGSRWTLSVDDAGQTVWTKII